MLASLPSTALRCCPLIVDEALGLLATDALADAVEKRSGEPAVEIANAAASASAATDTKNLAIRLPMGFRCGRVLPTARVEGRETDLFIALRARRSASARFRAARRVRLVDFSRRSRRRTGDVPSPRESNGSRFDNKDSFQDAIREGATGGFGRPASTRQIITNG